MKLIIMAVILLVALLSLVFTANSEPSVYACSEITKQDPVDIQKLCDKERRGKWWMI
jgi:hypothetical protein